MKVYQLAHMLDLTQKNVNKFDEHELDNDLKSLRDGLEPLKVILKQLHKKGLNAYDDIKFPNKETEQEYESMYELAIKTDDMIRLMEGKIEGLN